MAVLALLWVLVQSLLQFPQPAGDGLDEAAHRRMQERQELLEREMARLLQELEQEPLEQQDEGWGALLSAALQHWPFLLLGGVLLLWGLCFSLRRRSREANSSGKDQSSWNSLGDENGKEPEEDLFDSEEEGEKADVTVEAGNNSTGSEGEGSPEASNEGEGVDASEGNEHEKFISDSESHSEEGHDSQKDEGGSDGNVPGDSTGEGNEEEGGNVDGNAKGLDKANEGENEDMKMEQETDAGKEEEGDENDEQSTGVNMKLGNNVDLNDRQHETDGKQENTEVKEQESSDASEQRISDWTGQEDYSDGGKAVGHSDFAATEENTDPGNEKISVSNKDEKNGDKNVKCMKNEDGKEDELGSVAANEKAKSDEKAYSDGGKEAAGREGTEEEDSGHDVGKKRGILLVDRIQGPAEDLERGCSVTAELMESLTRVFADSVSNSFYPVPQAAIGVGSAFEGWSPSERDVVYRMLIPLNPPPGHSFHLEQSRAGQVAARAFRVQVELQCTCQREQLGEKMLCFVHHSEEELRQQQKPSLLATLCKGSYLDVKKTSRWFYRLLRSSWLQVPESHCWHSVFQPCSRSCQLQLSNGQKNLTVELLFGVCQGDSDIFVISQPPEAQKGSSISPVSSQPTKAKSMPSTVWLETYAVAEAKFFRHVTRQVPCESLHLKCLQVFTCILRGTGFSISTWKAVVIHVLTTVPPSSWRRREFERRLWDMMAYLRRCLQVKRLEHFVLGNERLPAEISIPAEMRTAEPLNLFEHLARDPAAHAQAMRAYGHLRLRLWTLLCSH